MQLPTRRALIRHIEDFADKHDIPETTICKQALNDYGFVAKLRDGREPQLKTAVRLYEWMKAYTEERETESLYERLMK